MATEGSHLFPTETETELQNGSSNEATPTSTPLLTVPGSPDAPASTISDAQGSSVTANLTITAENKGSEEENSGKSGDHPDLTTEAKKDGDNAKKDDLEGEDGGNEDSKEKGWDSSASLYCPKTGRAHSSLLDFGLWDCPKCRQSLESPKNLEVVESDSSSTTSSDSEVSKHDERKSKNGDAKEEGEEVKKTVSYSIEYRDSGNYEITTVPWDGPFDLTMARKGVVMKEDAVLEIITILDTSIASDSRRYSSEVRDLLEEGILNNPKISISVRTTKITILSGMLIKAITTIAPYYPDVVLQPNSLKLTEPYPLIAHYMQELEAYRATYSGHDSSSNSNASILSQRNIHTSHPRCNRETAEHLDMLLDFVKNFVYKNYIKEEEERHSRNLCTFRMLWLLFKPGDTVYLSSKGRLSAYIIKSVSVDDDILSTSPRRLWRTPYFISVWNLDYDGRFVGRSSRSVTIPHFEGERAVTSLKLFPCEFVDREDGGKTREKLEDYGEKWYELLCGGQIYYNGEFASSSRRQFEGRIYVDSASYYSQNPRDAPDISDDIEDMGEGLAKCSCEECHGRRPHPPHGFPWARYDVLDPKVEKTLEIPGAKHGARHRYLLCNYVLHGFALKSRKWEKLDVANCHTLKMNAKAIDTLVMPTARKEMIKALVQKFTGSNSDNGALRSWGADYIENKGEGQIFLLHGSPGVGKTYTAECIADYTGRALLSLTCGDIGTDEVQMEEQLSKWFRLGEKWGAVILIDEADVYLERRQVTDLKRNSLVSVFLRCLEYYRGILFLTTNRVGHFDDAFISRIHVVIRYENLTEEDRQKIWELFFDKLEDDRPNFMIASRAKEYVLNDEAVSKIEWNGREIRNAFQTAVALAEYRFSQKENKKKNEGPTLDQKDFEQVCAMARQFKEYLFNIHGQDEEDRAFYAKARVGHGHSHPGQVDGNGHYPPKQVQHGN